MSEIRRCLGSVVTGVGGPAADRHSRSGRLLRVESRRRRHPDRPGAGGPDRGAGIAALVGHPRRAVVPRRAPLRRDLGAGRNCGGISAMIKAGLGTGPGETASLLLVAAFVLFNPVMGMASASYACDLFGLGPAWTLPIAAVCMLVSVGFCFARVGTAAKLQGAMLVALLAGLAVAIVLASPSMSPTRLEHFAPHGWFSVGAALPSSSSRSSAGTASRRSPRRCTTRAARFRGRSGSRYRSSGSSTSTVVGAFLAMPHAADALVMPTLLSAGGSHARALGDVLALAVVALCTNSNVLCGSRLVVAAARDGLLPAGLARDRRRPERRPRRCSLWPAPTSDDRGDRGPAPSGDLRRGADDGDLHDPVPRDGRRRTPRAVSRAPRRARPSPESAPRACSRSPAWAFRSRHR